jgi:peptidyl-prolyl cis-trans isomerase A (cyclophilin A)
MKFIKFILILIAMVLFWSCSASNPRVLIKTGSGDIIVELFPDSAPVTVSNFVKYVEENRYEGAFFYRVVRMDNQPDDSIRIEVIQGGLFEENHPAMLPPIPHETTRETGILHKNGVISMARWQPGTATSEFFICVGDQPELDYGGKRNPDGQGFAAFGRVIEGMDVVKKIHDEPADGQYLNPVIPVMEILMEGSAKIIKPDKSP